MSRAFHLLPGSEGRNLGMPRGNQLPRSYGHSPNLAPVLWLVSKESVLMAECGAGGRGFTVVPRTLAFPESRGEGAGPSQSQGNVGKWAHRGELPSGLPEGPTDSHVQLQTLTEFWILQAQSTEVPTGSRTG